MALSPEAGRWFEARRGIRPETLEAFGVESAGEETVSFPYPGGARKYRKGFEKEERRFYWDPPTQAGQVPFLPPGFEPGSYMFLLEGETDTMAAWQHAPSAMKPRIVGLSGLNAWKDRYAEELFGAAKRVFVLFDNDDPYSPAQEQGDKSWAKIKRALGKKARRVVLPQGIEDVAELLMQYDWAALQALLKRADEPVRNYPRLDLTKPVPDTDWLVEDLLVRSEVTVIAADAGVGKSMMMQSLALAVAGGEAKWLGLAVKKQGRVMFVDEENSAQLAMQRLTALASTEQKAIETLPREIRDNLEYIWYAGVDLAHEPEKLLEDALEVEPELIVIDSQSRVAIGVEENSNTDISSLYRRGFIPLARDTGAAVVVIHHTPKGSRGPRGAGAAKAAADQAIEIVAAEDKAGAATGTLNIFPSKPRRRTAHLKARIVGDIEHDGWVRVERVEEVEPF